MKTRIKFLLFAASIVPMLTGCYEDKGNYTYSDVEQITVTFPTRMQSMQGDPIAFTPVVESSFKGVIKPEDPDYEYSCQLQTQWRDENGFSHNWREIDPEGTQAVNYSLNLGAQSYVVWYKVINKNTKVERNFQANYTVISATFEGWMVLSRDLSDDRARLDMIYTDANGDDRIFANVIRDNATKLYKPRAIKFVPTLYATPGDAIYLCCEGPGYALNPNTLNINSSQNLQSLFIIPGLAADMVNFAAIYDQGAGPDFKLCVTTKGDAHTLMGTGAGTSFEYCMNTDKVGNDPTYKVSPFIGSSVTTGSDCALMYDITNKRFIGCSYENYGSATDRVLYELPKPENPLFDFTTGLDIVDMTSSAFSGGDVFSILQRPDGHRVVYVINISGYNRPNSFKQNGYYDNITAPDFDTAVDYAAHSQYNYMFWCKDNKVYCYNYVLGKVADEITLPAGEKASLVKFNRWFNPLLMQDRLKTDEEFRAMENELIVGSSDGSENGGVIRFYKVAANGKLELHKEHKGLGQEIVDVAYRERRI